MDEYKKLVCNSCNGSKFLIKYEATYAYCYEIDSDAPGQKNTVEFLPFLFDCREQKSSQQYLECRTCGTKYPCYLSEWNKGVDIDSLQDAINSHPAK